MQQYLIKRILLFIPSLFFITLIAFIISAQAPGDPVSRMMGGDTEQPERREFYRERYLQLQKQLGLDLPLFYLSIHSQAMDADFKSIPGENRRKTIKSIGSTFGNGKLAVEYYHHAENFCRLNKGPVSEKVSLLLNYDDPDLIDDIYSGFSGEEKQEAATVIDSWQNLKEGKSLFSHFIPVIKFHFPNQYHRWLFGDGSVLTGEGALYTKGVIRGDFGRSYVSGKNAGKIIGERAGWTLFFAITGLLIALLIAIPTGVYGGSHPGSFADRFYNIAFMVLHSLPSFFFATLLLMLFANPARLGWFPASGIAPPGMHEGSIFKNLGIHLPYLVLPVAAFVSGALPFFMRTIRSGMLDELQKDYVLTGRAKGLSPKAVSWKHAFRNALLPLITIAGYIFPALIGGSVILETVFSIPGMGLEIVQAVFNRDYPLIIAMFTITGVLTVTGFLISDILYAVADPRIRLT